MHMSERLADLGVCIRDNWSRGHEFDPRHFHKSKCALGLERGPPRPRETIG